MIRIVQIASPTRTDDIEWIDTIGQCRFRRHGCTLCKLLVVGFIMVIITKFVNRCSQSHWLAKFENHQFLSESIFMASKFVVCIFNVGCRCDADMLIE